MPLGGQAGVRAHSEWYEPRLPACLPITPLIPVPAYRDDCSTGEKALWRATLQQALVEATSQRPRWGHFIQQAREWLLSESDEPQSCRWVCDVLGIEYEALRDKLLGGLRVITSHRGENKGLRHHINGRVVQGVRNYAERRYAIKPCERCNEEFQPTGSYAKWCTPCKDAVKAAKPRSHHPLVGV
jgi:hypothetical protein